MREVLELHLKDFPPQSGAEQLLLEREARLSEFRDARQPPAQRLAALEQANAALERLIHENAEDQRRFQWMYELANSLIFEQGATYATNVLYTGGSDEDRDKLAQIGAQALKTTRNLIERLESEFASIDGLTAGQFEKIENTQYMADLDRVAPNADYLLLWALFYDSLPRKHEDSARAAQLNEILSHLSRDPLILKAPQEQTHVQIPATVLAGATYRHLGDYHNARLFLDRARSLADRLSDAKEKLAVQWAVVLADIEAIRADRDDGRWPGADERIAQFRERIDDLAKDQAVDAFGLRLVAALLERSVNLKRADAVEQSGRTEEAAAFRRAAWRPLAQLALASPDRRDDLFAAVDRLSGADTPPDRRDPIELVARVAGLLTEADQKSGPAAESALANAKQLAQQFLDHHEAEAEALVPQMLRFLAVAQYRSGDSAAAAAGFTKLACAYASHPDAKQAAVYGVQLAAKLHHQSQAAPEVQQQYREALRCLLEKFADTEAADYWRFFYAQLLDELREYDAAAAQYALVKPTHEQYLESAYFRLRSLAQALQKQAQSPESAVPAAMSVPADGVIAAQRDLAVRANKEGPESAGAGAAGNQAMLAEGLVLTAESAMLPPIGRYRFGLDQLSDFEAQFPTQTALLGRVWRARLLGYQALGEAQQAAEAIAHYVMADPEGAGRMLQALYATASADYEAAVQAGNAKEAADKAQAALALAEHIAAWAEKHGSALSAAEKRYLAAQLAEAHLRVGGFEKARSILEPIRPPAGAQLPSGEVDLRIMLGYAASLAGVGDCEQALPLLNQLATGLPPTSAMRWQSLLGDLECRTKLGHAADGIIKVIEQQKLLYPDLGGSVFRGRFEVLRRENTRRQEAPAAAPSPGTEG